MNTHRSLGIAPRQRTFLLNTVRSIQNSAAGTNFLDAARRHSLKLEPFPTGMEPNPTLTMIEGRPRQNQYKSVRGFVSDVERIVHDAEKKWGVSHRVTEAGREVLAGVRARYRDAVFKQAPIKDLIRDGLFELMPELEVPIDYKREGLYTSQVIYRKIGYPPREARPNEDDPPIYSYEHCPRPIQFTTDILELVRKLALNFLDVPPEVDKSKLEPPLHAFLHLLTLQKRQQNDPVFMRWIKQHYKGMQKCDLSDNKSANLSLW